MIQKRKFTKFQLKTAFEYFSQQVTQPGKRPTYSAFVWENYNRLAPVYGSIMQTIQSMPQQAERMKIADELQALHQTRLGNGVPNGVEADAEIDKKIDELNQKGAQLAAEANVEINKILNTQGVELEVDCLTLSEFIDDAPPFIVGPFKYN